MLAAILSCATEFGIYSDPKRPKILVAQSAGTTQLKSYKIRVFARTRSYPVVRVLRSSSDSGCRIRPYSSTQHTTERNAQLPVNLCISNPLLSFQGILRDSSPCLPMVAQADRGSSSLAPAGEVMAFCVL